ncbi:MAG: ABC transporter permease [Anaerolineaceae bacterium]|nr:ABC transporter permease [Anaerolineaceae bacterium]
MTTTTIHDKEKLSLKVLWGRIRRVHPVFYVFIIVFLLIGYLNPKFLEINGIFTFLRRAAPLGVLTVGQLFVIAAGGFDLSVGSTMTFVVIAGALMMDNDPEKLGSTLLILYGMGAVIGLINGLVVSYLRVPSFIATLGMLLALKGAGLFWTGGAPRGYLTENFRMFGRGFIQDVPLVGRIPYAVLILIAVVAIMWFIFHKTNFGRQILSVGDNPIAAKLSGIKVKKIRILSFIVSSLTAITAGILEGGFGGVNIIAGEGFELQAISAAVLGGAVLLGGRGAILAAAFGALTLEALFNLLNLIGQPEGVRYVVQGLIIIGAVSYAALRKHK